jgi:plastocyanin
MMLVRRARLAAPLLALVLTLGVVVRVLGQQATPQSQVVQSGETRSFPASIHQGTCDQLGQTAYQLAPIGLPQGGQLVHAPATPAYESVTTIPNVTLDDFVNADYAIPISKSATEVDSVVACGLVGGTRYGDNLLFSLGPIGDQTFAAVVKMTQDQKGVTVTIDLIINPGNGATPVAAASPAASLPTTPIVGSSPAAVNQSGQAQDTQNQQTVTMVDIAFQPTELTIPANTDVTITLTNKGASVHNFNIDDLDIHSGDIQPGQSGSVTINAHPGDHEYYCSIPGHKEAGMVGTLHVQ